MIRPTHALGKKSIQNFIGRNSRRETLRRRTCRREGNIEIMCT